ncbi:delta-aminolevulinic acid dehydratase [Kiloniella litopenaei]|uniref:Delta-aminolevulinic acid dehydratase n=1 Tax=Kiloniella litopenaei TaxID=1549748 RepID=A0A0M2R5Y8_9PROT|nr:porphobilinogen synthase [Kiloniella litopenaei]KKJ75864.1 delta-aminolevulinic acid dehydratase [Kiloniella litopenaei]
MNKTFRQDLVVRPRRIRTDDWTRRMVAENRLSVDDFIWPVFLQENNGTSDVPSMPGVKRYGPDCLVDAIAEAVELGIPAIALFPYNNPETKTEDCREAYNPDNLICQATRSIRKHYQEIALIGDVALDPYNSLGHDGIVKDGVILNDESVEILCRQALVQAEAGCDYVGPSDMMDGRIGAIRDTLDEAGYTYTKIMAYSAKYASGFYGPFRDAVGAKGALKGDKKTYQMDPANSEEALRLVENDLQQGADMVMVKPGIAYLDIIQRIKNTFGVPTMAYQVSGEYAMIKAASANGWLDHDAVMMESLMAFKRAGTDAVLTYFALEAARLLK